jgi:hypothetical protein
MPPQRMWADEQMHFICRIEPTSPQKIPLIHNAFSVA